MVFLRVSFEFMVGCDVDLYSEVMNHMLRGSPHFRAMNSGLMI